MLVIYSLRSVVATLAPMMYGAIYTWSTTTSNPIAYPGLAYLLACSADVLAELVFRSMSKHDIENPTVMLLEKTESPEVPETETPKSTEAEPESSDSGSNSPTLSELSAVLVDVPDDEDDDRVAG